MLVGLRVALVFGLALTFYPLVKAFTLGQIQVWINGLFAVGPAGLGDRLARRQRRADGHLVPDQAALRIVRAVGAAAQGMALCIRLRRRRLRRADRHRSPYSAATNHLDYLPVLSHLAERGETYYPNHSVNGLLNRLMSVFEPELYRNLEWGDGSFPPFNRLGLLVDDDQLGRDPPARHPAAQPRQRSRPRRRLLHHGGELHGRLSDRLGASLRRAVPGVRGRAGRRAAQPARLPWLVASYVLASNYFIATQLLAPTFWNFVQSYLLFATWILLVLLHLRPPLPLPSANAARRCAGAASGDATHERDALFVAKFLMSPGCRVRGRHEGVTRLRLLQSGRRFCPLGVCSAVFSAAHPDQHSRRDRLHRPPDAGAAVVRPGAGAVERARTSAGRRLLRQPRYRQPQACSPATRRWS